MKYIIHDSLYCATLYAESYIREMVLRMEDEPSSIIAGPRRIGKSGVGREILRQVQQQGQYVAAVDLFSANSTDILASVLLQSIPENRAEHIRRSVRAPAIPSPPALTTVSSVPRRCFREHPPRCPLTARPESIFPG